MDNKVENDFSPQQSLALIESMINRAKDRFVEDGSVYLFWGWLVLACSVLQFILLHVYHYPQHYIVWFILFPVFFYRQFFVMPAKNRQRAAYTYTDYIIGFVWITFAILCFLLAFAIGFLTTGAYYAFIIHILLAVYGMPVFLTGIIIRFKPLITGGICCWILCIASTFIKVYDYQYLLIPLAMLIAWIIPGYMLRARFKSQ